MKETNSICGFGALLRAFHVLTKTPLCAALILLFAAQAAQAIDAFRIATGFDKPLCLAAPPGDSERLFVAEQTGRIRIINLASRTVNPTPFLDVSGEITTQGNEQGLLGLAFDPGYSTNGRFYISYTAPGGSFGNGVSHIAQLTVSANPDIADPSSLLTLLSFDSHRPITTQVGSVLARARVTKAIYTSTRETAAISTTRGSAISNRVGMRKVPRRCSGKSSGFTSKMLLALTAFRRTTLSLVRRPKSRRFGYGAFAIRGVIVSIARPAICLSVM